MGWCVGCNPPSVVCGIRLIGLPAPSGRYFIGDCLPFPLAGRPFHRFQSSALDITNVSLPVWVDVSFLLRCQRSRAVPGDCNSTCGRSFLRPKFGSESHTPTRQPTPKCNNESNKHTLYRILIERMTNTEL